MVKGSYNRGRFYGSFVLCMDYAGNCGYIPQSSSGACVFILAWHDLRMGDWRWMLLDFVSVLERVYGNRQGQFIFNGECKIVSDYQPDCGCDWSDLVYWDALSRLEPMGKSRDSHICGYGVILVYYGDDSRGSSLASGPKGI